MASSPPILLAVSTNAGNVAHAPRFVDGLPALLHGLEQFAGWPTEIVDERTAVVTVVRPGGNHRVRLRWVAGRPVSAELAICEVPASLAGEALVTVNAVNAVLPVPGLVFVEGQVRWRTAVQAVALSVAHMTTLLLAGVYGAEAVRRELKQVSNM